VGKSSLLNVVDSQLNLGTSDVSDSNTKGRHTTRRARLLPLKNGGWVADTPGIRQFELWDVTLEEVDGYFIEFRPFVPYCRFPNCSHTHEETCGVKDAVVANLIDLCRYDSYLRIREENIFVWKNPARGQT
jgi:ribosome biogenesis GTPase